MKEYRIFIRDLDHNFDISLSMAIVDVHTELIDNCSPLDAGLIECLKGAQLKGSQP